MEWVNYYLKRDPTVIFDIGTWDGGDGISFKRAWPRARVVAFEACPKVWAKIVREGMVANAGVAAFHYAVCNHNRGVFFFSNRTPTHPEGMSGSLLPPTAKLRQDAPFLHFETGATKVPSTRLDAFCAAQGIDHIDLIHMDVQGAEGMVLQGLGALRPGLIFMEIDETGDVGHYAGSLKLKELRALVEGLGYALADDTGHDALYVSQKLP